MVQRQNAVGCGLARWTEPCAMACSSKGFGLQQSWLRAGRRCNTKASTAVRAADHTPDVVWFILAGEQLLLRLWYVGPYRDRGGSQSQGSLASFRDMPSASEASLAVLANMTFRVMPASQPPFAKSAWQDGHGSRPISHTRLLHFRPMATGEAEVGVQGETDVKLFELISCSQGLDSGMMCNPSQSSLASRPACRQSVLTCADREALGQINV